MEIKIMRINKSEAMSGRETACVVINLIAYKLFTVIPVWFSKNGASAAFLSAVFAFAAAALAVYFCLKLYYQNAEGSIIDAALSALGKGASAAVAAVFGGYLIVSAVFALSQLSNLVKLMAFPTAPIWFIELFFVIAAAISAAVPKKGIIRTHLVLVPVCIAIVIFMLASVVPSVDMGNIFPIMGLGAKGVFLKGLGGTVMFSDILVLFLLKPFCADRRRLNKPAFCAAVFAAALAAVFVLIYSTLVPYPASADGTFPIYSVMKNVYYGRFLQRIDALVMLAAVLSGMLYISLTVSVAADTLGEALGGVRCGAYALPIALIVFWAAHGGTLAILRELRGILAAAAVLAAVTVIVISACAARRRKTNEAM